MENTNKTNELLSNAVKKSATLGNPNVEPIHLLQSLLNADANSIHIALLNSLNINLSNLKNQVDTEVNKLPQTSGTSVSTPQLSRSTYEILQSAEFHKYF